MTFLVEDGTGLADANAYCTVEFSDAYFTQRGATVWFDFDEARKQSLIMQGSEYADLRWGMTLKGSIATVVQALEFPRAKLTDRYGRAITGVPTDWKKAVCEYAISASKGDLIAESGSTDTAILKSKKTVVGPITTEREYMDGSAASSSAFGAFPKADTFASQYVSQASNSGIGKVIRS